VKHSLLSRVWAKFANFVNRHPFLSEMRVLGLKPLFKHKLTFTNFFIIIQLLILVLRITLDKTKSKREEEQITWFCKKKYMHKETLINIITCTRTTPPPPPISSSTTMIFPTSQMWRDPKKYGPNVKYPNSKPQKPNLCKDIYRYRLVLMLLPQTRFKQMQNLSFERAVGWPKKVLKNKIAA
jgi:hypothetical protein